MKALTIITASLLGLGIAQAEMFTGAMDISNKTLEDVIVVGAAHLKEVKANSIKVTGVLLFDKLDVLGNVTILGPITEGSTDLLCNDLHVIGPVSARRINCLNIDVLGSSQFEDIQVSGDVTLVGNVNIKKADIQNLYVISDQIDLEDVTIKNITIDHIPFTSETQTLYLKGSSIISGTITFKSGKGIIVKGDKVKITNKMIGGTEMQTVAKKR